MRKLEVFSAPQALFDSNRLSNFKDVLFISKELGGFDEEELQKEWSTLPEDLTLLPFVGTQDFNGMWKTLLSAKDNEGFLQYRNLRDLLKTIRTLPHSNADAERTFSTIIDILTDKHNRISAESVNSLCVVKSGLQAQQESPATMTITEEHLNRKNSQIMYAG